MAGSDVRPVRPVCVFHATNRIVPVVGVRECIPMLGSDFPRGGHHFSDPALYFPGGGPVS